VTSPVPGFHWRIWAAEATGTALMMLAIVAAASLALGRGSPVAEALPDRGAGFFVLGAIVAPCVALIAVSPLGRLSGAHINPAVTMGFWSLGRVSRHDLVGYVGAQLLGDWQARTRPGCYCLAPSSNRSAAPSRTPTCRSPPPSPSRPA